MGASPTVFCLDANSSPERTESATVWKLLRGVDGAKSVWDEWVGADGQARPGKEMPCSTNKMRGPLSQQPKKIGEHAYGLIDHIFFGGLELVGHRRPPTVFKSTVEARAQFLPSVATPSDHFPVVVDLSLPAPRPRVSAEAKMVLAAAALAAAAVACYCVMRAR